MNKKTNGKQVMPVVLGSVVALTGTICGGDTCDMCADYAHGGPFIPDFPPPYK